MGFGKSRSLDGLKERYRTEGTTGERLGAEEREGEEREERRERREREVR